MTWSIAATAVLLAGISAAARIKKSCLVLCTNSVSVDQWRYQFTLWSTLQQDQVPAHASPRSETSNLDNVVSKQTLCPNIRAEMTLSTKASSIA